MKTFRLQIRTSDQNMLIDDLRHENDLLQKDNQRHNATIDEYSPHNPD
jgi:hypothetical protein